MPPTPTTVLDQALPLFAGVPDIPAYVLLSVALIGIPLLVVAGLTPRWSLRVLMGAALVAVLSVAAWSSEPTGHLDFGTVALAVAGMTVVSLGIVVWGSLSAWSWIVAALFFAGLAGLRFAVYGFVWQERGAGALRLVVAAALIALIALGARRAASGANRAPEGLTQF